MNVSYADMERKVATFRQITGGNSFSLCGLPKDTLDRMGYKHKNCLQMLIKSLVDGTSKCGRQLNKIGYGQYCWVNQSGRLAEPEKSIPIGQFTLGLNDNQMAAVDLIKELVIQIPQGQIRLTAKMVALSDEEFEEFAEKMEIVKVMFTIGKNDHSSLGCVWTLARDKFADFCKLLESAPLLPPPPPFVPEPAKVSETKPKTTKSLDPENRKLSDLCDLLESEIAKCDRKLSGLEEQAAETRKKRSEATRRLELYKQELNKLNNG